MSRELIITGDKVMFDTVSFMKNEPLLKFMMPVLPLPLMMGSGTDSVMMMKGCLEGDEQKVKLPGIMFAKPPGHPIPGVGMFSIDKLNGDQLSKKTTCDGKKLILKGSEFDAKFTVISPPFQLPPPASGGAPDTKLEYKGKGKFIPNQNKATAT